jgi:4-carboxymuconolactone decarboxylase
MVTAVQERSRIMLEPDDNPDALRRGTQLFGEEHCRRVFEQTRRWDPGFSRLFQDYVYGGMYDRDVLDQRTRELVAVAACTCLNALQQLTVHTRAAVRSGARLDEVQEVILQMSVYCGFPFVLQAMRHLDTLREDLQREEQEYQPGSER